MFSSEKNFQTEKGEKVLDATHRIKGGVLRTACSVSTVCVITTLSLLAAVKNVENTGNATLPKKRLSPKNGEFQGAGRAIQFDKT